MSEPQGRDQLPQATIVPPRRWRISAIWIIPILAALVAIGIAVQRILNEGPSVVIVFTAVEGIEAGKTFIKYKDVNIGQVKAIRLTDDFKNVESHRKDRQARRRADGAGRQVLDRKPPGNVERRLWPEHAACWQLHWL